MKKALIAALLCLNVGLLLALVLGAGVPTAEAQVAGGGRDYIMVTGHLSKDRDAVFILDLSSRRLVALKMSPEVNNPKLLSFRGRDLRRDFGRAVER